jgi:rRNA maturation protein Nop10
MLARKIMSYTIDIKCPACGKIIFCEHIDEIEELAEGVVSFYAKCNDCGFEKEYLSVPADEAEKMMEEGRKLLKP